MKEKLEQWLRAAFQLKASDVHLSVGMPPVFRINGGLKRYGSEALRPEDTEQISQLVIDEKYYGDFEEAGEIDISYGIQGLSRFRVNAYRQRSCVSLAFRIIPTSIPSMEDLMLPESVRKMAGKHQGLVLVTGPTGSGKSTTLASMIDFMNRTMSRHIITLEDPIEYLHKHRTCVIDQREIGFDTNNFANGLRAALRQDPDVILLGEMRDLETIATAITAAETGHLVLGTLHTTNASSTIDRIVDVFPPEQQGQIRIQLASVLVGVMSQRLLPTNDGKGRRAITEVLVNTPAVANLIRNEKIHQIHSVMQTSKNAGMHTFEMSAKEALERNEVSREFVEPYLLEKGG
ncbi:type IV pilus twitching motility protein PilT [Fictibacillus sp. 23RED33]|jgi:twitching motility protein PilT|uniref:type IV pilus twitching motility protein PilT n=1 Tax=Fictibacillus TaxID=1329200 RepID=UPI001293C9BD|nr:MULTISPECIES: type IV pilus twitching motility protein PilT [Fictibacillus]MBH0173845.1 type IV pilus twitching motility protein PilT [Fictibacillus sp. 23RED33]MQR94843.1 type IV pilus twitching motility protein PilT [Fictibacillus phosphorivorans]